MIEPSDNAASFALAEILKLAERDAGIRSEDEDSEGPYLLHESYYRQLAEQLLANPRVQVTIRPQWKILAPGGLSGQVQYEDLDGSVTTVTVRTVTKGGDQPKRANKLRDQIGAWLNEEHVYP